MKFSVTFVCSAVLALSACSPLLQRGDPIEIWQLPQTQAMSATGNKVAWQLRVAAPEAPGLLAGSRIAVMPIPGQINVYGGARWSQPVPELLRDRLISAFRGGGQISAVSSDDSNLHADFELGGSLDAFQAEYDGNSEPTVVIRYDARLIDPDSQRILAARRFTAQQAVDGTDVAKVVAAFGQAADALSAQIVAWTVKQGQQHWSATDTLTPTR